MNKVEMFFDYACPFCWRAFKSLYELLPEYPQIEMIWHLCEAHPRPEEGFGLHSDLVIEGMFFAKDSGLDILAYHKQAFSLMHVEKVNVEDIETLVLALSDFADPSGLRRALEAGRYRQMREEANDFAYQESGVWVIPDFRAGEHKLVAEAGVGVTAEQLRAFLHAVNTGQ